MNKSDSTYSVAILSGWIIVVLLIIVGVIAVLSANGDQEKFKQNKRDYCQYEFNYGPRGDFEKEVLRNCLSRVDGK